MQLVLFGTHDGLFGPCLHRRPTAHTLLRDAPAIVSQGSTQGLMLDPTLHSRP
jgi:hypothetical protein